MLKSGFMAPITANQPIPIKFYLYKPSENALHVFDSNTDFKCPFVFK